MVGDVVSVKSVFAPRVSPRPDRHCFPSVWADFVEHESASRPASMGLGVHFKSAAAIRQVGATESQPSAPACNKPLDFWYCLYRFGKVSDTRFMPWGRGSLPPECHAQELGTTCQCWMRCLFASCLEYDRRSSSRRNVSRLLAGSLPWHLACERSGE